MWGGRGEGDGDDDGGGRQLGEVLAESSGGGDESFGESFTGEDPSVSMAIGSGGGSSG